MKSVVFVVLVSCAAFAAAASAGVGSIPSMKALSSLKLTRDAVDDVLTIQAYFMGCPDALILYDTCLAQNNYNPSPVTNDEICASARLELQCMRPAFDATSCAGKQEAVAAMNRTVPLIDQFCELLGSTATTIFAGFVTVVVMACGALLR